MPQTPIQTPPAQGAPGQGGPGQGGAAGQAGRGGAAGAAAGGGRGAAPTVPDEFDGLKIWVLKPAELLAMLKDPKSSEFQKAIACKKLAFVGGKDSVAPMAALLSDPHLSCYARFGMEPNPDPSVDEAFRAALPKLKGKQLQGVINSIAVRKDARALDALTKLMDDSDVDVACAAAAAIGQIGGLAGAKVLQNALATKKGPLFAVAARATLVCTDNLMAAPATKARAMELYSALSATTMPAPVMLAALRALNANGPAAPGARKWVAPTGAAAEADASGFLGPRGARGGGAGAGRGATPATPPPPGGRQNE
jgi:hypothetical protein